MNVQNETEEQIKYMPGFYSSITEGFDISQGSYRIGITTAKPAFVQEDTNAKLDLAIRELHLGERIRNELKEQGRTVSWLAQQLGMERTSLYYVFRQNSIDMELLLRISFLLGHNFVQDVVEVCKDRGLS